MTGENNHASTRASTLAVLAIALYGAVLIWNADTRIIPGLDADRYAFMECLVERGVFHVDDSSMVSVDRIRVGNHFYSEKPPLLNFAGAGVYAVVHMGLGWRFKTHPNAVVRVMIAVFVVVPVCILLWMFWRACMHRGARAAACTALLAVGSILLPYSIAFTNHPLAGTLLFAAFLLLGNPLEPQHSKRWFLVGLLASLSAAIDLIPGTVFYVVVSVYAFRRGKRALAACIGGGAVTGLLHLSLNALTLGTLVPGYLIPGADTYPGSPWLVKDAVDIEFPNYGAALYHYLLGHRSVAMLEPLLFVGAVGAMLVLREGDRERARPAVASLGVLAAVLVLVPWVSLRGLGGSAYGPRHLVPVAALMYFYLPDALSKLRQPVARAGIALLAGWSLLTNGIGVLDPWCGRDLSAYDPLEVLATKLATYTDSDLPDWIVEFTARDVPHGYSVLGRIRRQSGRPEKAIVSYQKALRIAPFWREALYGLGIVACETQRYDMAISLFERLLADDPRNPWALTYLGFSKYNQGKVDEARKALDNALQIDPANPLALELADVLAKAR